MITPAARRSPHETLFTTSWDDGHPADLRLAELMQRHGIRGTFYCPVENREGLPVVGASELRSLDAAFEVGSHTFNHAYFDRIGSRHWAEEVALGKAALEDRLGHAVLGFCYPGGRRTPAAQAIVRAAGFDYARTTENFRLDAGDDSMAMPTTLQLYPHSRFSLARNLVRGGAWRRRQAAGWLAVCRSGWIDRAMALLDVALAHGGLLHFWGHSWEIERLELWAALDRLFGEVASRIPEASRLTNGEVHRRFAA